MQMTHVISAVTGVRCSSCNYDPTATGMTALVTLKAVWLHHPNACNSTRLPLCQRPVSFPANPLIEDCDGNCLNDTDGDGVCDEQEIGGCTTEGPGYDPYATEDDGSCPAGGCIIPSPVFSCNYDPNADYLIIEMCLFLPCETASGSPTPGGMITGGCTDFWACNYDPSATENDGHANTPHACCSILKCNYDPTAVYNDGSWTTRAVP